MARARLVSPFVHGFHVASGAIRKRLSIETHGRLHAANSADSASFSYGISSGEPREADSAAEKQDGIFTSALGRSETGAAGAPPGSNTMPYHPASNLSFTAVTFSDATKARAVRSLYRVQRYGQYLGLPNTRTLVVQDDDLSWLKDTLAQHGFKEKSDYSLSRVVPMGELSAKEIAAFKRRQPTKKDVSGVIEKMLDQARRDNQELRKKRSE